MTSSYSSCFTHAHPASIAAGTLLLALVAVVLYLKSRREPECSSEDILPEVRSFHATFTAISDFSRKR
jgi:hypothetical protein